MNTCSVLAGLLIVVSGLDVCGVQRADEADSVTCAESVATSGRPHPVHPQPGAAGRRCRVLRTDVCRNGVCHACRRHRLSSARRDKWYRGNGSSTSGARRWRAPMRSPRDRPRSSNGEQLRRERPIGLAKRHSDIWLRRPWRGVRQSPSAPESLCGECREALHGRSEWKAD